MIQNDSPIGCGFFIFFQDEVGTLRRREYKERYKEDYEGGILSRIFAQYVAPEVIDESTEVEIRVPEEETEIHLKTYAKDHNFDGMMSALIIREIVKRPDLVEEVEKTEGMKKSEAREVLFEALIEDLSFKIEKDEEDVAMLMILIEAI